MPSHKIHCLADRMYFGRSFWKLHKALDKPYFAMGRRHRIVFHDPWSATLIARKVYPNDPMAEEAAALHLLLDASCSEDRAFHEGMKCLYALELRTRRRVITCKRKNENKAAVPRSVKQFEKTLRQLLEIQQLRALIYS